MKKLILGAIAVLLFAPSVHAADMPVKAAAASVWRDGFYAGGNLGYSWGTVKSDVTTTANTTQAFSTSSDLDGFLIGGQIGYNWFRNRWMFGIEGDFDWTWQKGSTAFTCGPTLCTTTTAVTAPATSIPFNYDTKLRWLGTVRGRVGPMISPTTFVYFTGGLAVGQIKTEGVINGFSAGGAISGAFDNSTTKCGWTIGGGFESRLQRNWSVKVEYLYVDLGRADFTAFLPTNAPPLTAAFSQKVTDNIVRVGLNYQFQ
jgi:outer membrane immunogenic protein